MNLAIALQRIRPGALWTASEDTYAALRWMDQVQDKPTEAELEDAWADELAERPAREAEQAQRLAEAEALRLQLLGAFATLAPGVQVAFKPTADAMRDAFARADIATARAILATTPVLPELEDSKAALLALFPPADE